MGCNYAYNPSEIYQRTKPGMGVETHCGARTFPAVDEPEQIPVRQADGTYRMQPTGRLLAREQADPYCPAHGGSSEPAAVPVSYAELQAARAAYADLVARYDAQVPPVVPVAALASSTEEPPVTAEQVSQAAANVAQLEQGGLTDGQ